MDGQRRWIAESHEITRMSRISENSPEDDTGVERTGSSGTGTSATPSQPKKMGRKLRSPKRSPPASLRRRSPKGSTKENEIPRMWKDGSAAENNARRLLKTKKRSKVSFSSAPNHQHQLSHFTIQEEVDIDSEDAGKSSQDTDDTPAVTETETGFERPLSEHVFQIETDHEDNPKGGRPSITRGDGQMELQTSERMYHAPTKLHAVCKNAATVNDLLAFFHAPTIRGRNLASYASREDNKGRIPLHIFSQNHNLAAFLFSPDDEVDFDTTLTQSTSSGDGSSKDRKLYKFVLECLLSTNPAGLVAQDQEGRIPFEKTLTEWVQRSYELERERSEKTFSSFNRRSSDAASKLHDVWMTTSMSVSTAINWAGRSLHFQQFDDGVSILPTTDPRDPEDHQQPQRENSQKTLMSTLSSFHRSSEKFALFPSNVRLTSLSRFAIKTLSFILDELEGQALKRSFRKQRRDRVDDEIENLDEIIAMAVDKIASIPNFMSSIFLLDDDDEREWALSMSLIKRLAVSPVSVGPWINSALQANDRKISCRGLDYLEYTSHIIKYGRSEKERVSLSNDDANHRHKETQENFEDAISQLDGFIPSLLALEERKIEQAATTEVVRKVLDRMIARPFACKFHICRFPSQTPVLYF